MRKYIYLFLLVIIASVYSCKDFLEPAQENIIDEDLLFKKPEWIEGLLLRSYINLPVDYSFYTDIITDDAVTNLKGSTYTRMALGEWSSEFYPLSKWSNAYEQIYYINKFLNIYELVKYATDPNFSDEENNEKDRLHKIRLKGEAHGMRAWYKMELLQYHAGKADDGRFLGFVIMDENVSSTDKWDLPRNTFAECVNSIMDDLDIAIANLPAIYEDGDDNIVNKTSGKIFDNRINGNAAKALKSRVALLAASPSFSETNIVTWAEAATIAGRFLAELGELPATGKTFYLDTKHSENIWNTSQRDIRTWEANNFPPSLFGSGRTNPSQNLVDAFPMENGYPIHHHLSGFDIEQPYLNRDPRLNDYIIYDGSIFKSTVINTHTDSPEDGINSLETSTRTGYYLKKFMNPSVTLKPGNLVNRMHSYTLFRYTETLLNYAEAANEAWGPDGDPIGIGFTARSKIAQLRARGGIAQPDTYLESITDKEDMRALIRNERRIELCFEGFRFWDIRRWGLETIMNTPVKGVFITPTPLGNLYEYSDIEARWYSSYMIYPPIPYTEILKYDITQNNGW